MIKKSTYVRCSIDVTEPLEPRDFALAKVIDIDDFAETADLQFFDLYGLRDYYALPENYTQPLSKITRCRINNGSSVEYGGSIYSVKSCELNKDEDLYYYYIYSYEYDKLLYVPETKLKASFNDSYVLPLKQMASYEFQNPTWLFGRCNVSKTMKVIESSVYGFKELAGCKIRLMPHQLKTVMRCLSDKLCRYMIADEVGMGKTIEAASVLKIFMSDKYNKKILLVIPDALVEQWRTELAFKFHIFEAENCNGNHLEIIPASRILSVQEGVYDFVVIDEVHRMIFNEALYNKALSISMHTDNVLLLSATPIQSRKDEYHKLMTLIQPSKYLNMSEEEFDNILAMQKSVIRMVYNVYESLVDYKQELEDSGDEINEDIEEIFDEIKSELESIGKKVGNNRITEMVDAIDIKSDDLGIYQIEKVIAYICEAYQLEKSIIRNRRAFVEPSIDFERQLVDISYSLDDDCNSTEYALYLRLSEWIDGVSVSDDVFRRDYMPFISAFFSSSAALCDEIGKSKIDIPDDIRSIANKRRDEEITCINNLGDLLSDPYENYSRIVRIMDYLDQEAYNKKVILFTDYQGTFELYKKALVSYFGEDVCCFFNTSMPSDELELNTFRFQSDENYKFMLSDKSGGEGRNFQNADVIIHIDIPWAANDLEQRIGRLARIGRESDKPVISVVSYAADTLESNIFSFWNDGLKIFSKSQSGLEIIMSEIDKNIIEAVNSNFKYGLSDIIPQIIEKVTELTETVKRERHFDVAQYKYQVINKNIEATVKKYQESETELFVSSMLSWARLTGFNGGFVDNECTIIRYNAASFSGRSAFNTLFVPPDMKRIIDDKMNQMQNRVRGMSGKSNMQQEHSYIQGTFNREIALKSDYIHFFAPGDEIYDSITDNALRAYKGKCSAIAVNGPIDWKGFVYGWTLEPDELVLMKNNIPVRKMEQYRQFIDYEMLYNAVSISECEDNDINTVLTAFKTLLKMTSSDIKSNVEHLGQRSCKKRFLGLTNTSGMSNIEMFRSKHPADIWQNSVKSCYQKAKEDAINKLKKKIRRSELKETLLRQRSEEAISSEYYGNRNNYGENSEAYENIFKAFSSAKVVLDSICYIRMIKTNE